MNQIKRYNFPLLPNTTNANANRTQICNRREHKTLSNEELSGILGGKLGVLTALRLHHISWSTQGLISLTFGAGAELDDIVTALDSISEEHNCQINALINIPAN